MKGLTALSLAVVAALAATAALAAGAASTHRSATPKRGGHITIARIEDSNSFDKTNVFQNESIWITEQMMEPLYLAGNDGKTLRPWLATSYKASKDGKTYTFTVRKGLRFSDGSPVTAAAFKRALERNLSPEMGSPLGVNVQIDKLIAGGSAFLDGKTKVLSGVSAKGQVLVVKLTKANPTFVSIMAMQWFAAVKPDTPYTDKGLTIYPSAGPYYIKAHDVGRSLLLARNPYYKGNRPSNPDQIVFTVNTDQAQTFLQVKNGDFDYDAGAGPPPTEYEGLGDRKSVV